ncbi:hypothetical protein ACWDYH_07705 [Nocardia goodfellowii]
MTFIAHLDFDRFFGPPLVCPACGSAAIGFTHGHSDTPFHCRICDTSWQWSGAASALEVKDPDPVRSDAPDAVRVAGAGH